jgi:hypothetical protein
LRTAAAVSSQEYYAVKPASAIHFNNNHYCGLAVSPIFRQALLPTSDSDKWKLRFFSEWNNEQGGEETG